jgi:pimeloyl-ACP methyl ester carboxylesterase
MSDEPERVDLFSETLRLAYVQRGSGRVFLLLHGGAGPGSMRGLADALGERACALLPIHPGFDGEPRPERFTRVDDLALAYLALLEKLDLGRVVVVGNSIGGWIAAELALRRSPRVAGLVLLDAVGIDTGSPDRTIPDPDEVAPAELLARAFHDPANAAGLRVNPAWLASNGRTLRVYAGQPFMHDPGLRARLASMATPTLVAWGESDRLIDLDYGKRWAASIPSSRFEVIPKAGHAPQVERLDDTRRLIEHFASTL